MLTWFNQQNKAVKLIVLLVPILNWIMEIGCRFEVCNKTKKAGHIFLFIFVLITGMAFGWIDFLAVLFTNKMLFTE